MYMCIYESTHIQNSPSVNAHIGKVLSVNAHLHKHVYTEVTFQIVHLWKAAYVYMLIGNPNSMNAHLQIPYKCIEICSCTIIFSISLRTCSKPLGPILIQRNSPNPSALTATPSSHFGEV